MSRFVSQMLAGDAILILPLGAFVLFALVFTGVCLQQVLRGPKAYARIERAPLEDNGEPDA